MRSAVYPGSFDPPTNGHMDLIARASRLYDKVVVALGRNSIKNPLFSVEDRRRMLEEECARFGNVSVEVFDGLLVDFCRAQRIEVILRGMRAISDFEKEFQMALTNRTLEPGVETVFLPTSADLMFVSSSIVREIARLGGDVSRLVPDSVARKLAARLSAGVDI